MGLGEDIGVGGLGEDRVFEGLGEDTGCFRGWVKTQGV